MRTGENGQKLLPGEKLYYAEDLVEMPSERALLNAQDEIRQLGHRVVFTADGLSWNLAGVFIPKEKLKKSAGGPEMTDSNTAEYWMNMMRDVQTERDSLRESLADRDRRIAELEACIKEQIFIVDGFQKQDERLRKMPGDAERQIAELQAENASLKNTIECLKREVEALKEACKMMLERQTKCLITFSTTRRGSS